MSSQIKALQQILLKCQPLQMSNHSKNSLEWYSPSPNFYQVYQRLLSHCDNWSVKLFNGAGYKYMTKPSLNDPVLRYFDPSKPITLQCDASEGFGFSLLQDGQPVHVISAEKQQLDVGFRNGAYYGCA